MPGDIAIVIGIGVVAALAGLLIGRRLAPRLDRLADRPQEDDDGND